MTKMQIVAETVLVILGIYIVAALCSHLVLIQSITDTTSFVFLAGFAILIAVAILFLIFKNDNLARKMAGDGEKLNPSNEAIWLAASLRLGAVLCGLIVLSTSMPTIVSVLTSPVYVRLFVNEMFLFKSFPLSFVHSPQVWCTAIYNFLKVILAIYLLCGAPHFIRWQLKHVAVINSERSDNE